MGCLPVLNKPARTPSFIIDENADTIFMVSIPNLIQVPIFELHCGEEGTSIEEQIQELLGVLLDAAKFETCTNDTEPGGAFYGLLRANYRMQNRDGWMWTVELGLAFSEEVLTPHFDDLMASGAVFSSHELKPDECQRIGLPTLLEVSASEPELYRPTRFEREDVI